MSPDDYERLSRRIAIVASIVMAYAASSNISSFASELPSYMNAILGVMSALASSAAWAITTTFGSKRRSDFTNYLAALFAALSTGFFVPASQL
jgi:drug/metabolite transporter (DMT)-like permease